MLFVAERHVPIGLASLIFASVPLWLVVLRSTTGDRPPRASLVGTAFGFIGVALLLRPGGDATVSGVLLVVASALSWALGTFLSSKLPMPGDALTTAGIQGLAGGLLLLPVGAALADGESLDPADWSTRSLLGLLYLIVFGSIFGYTAYVWLVAQRAARHGRDLRLRQPARRDHARRPLPGRGGDVADRGRCGGDPDLGRGRDPQEVPRRAGETIPPLVES